MPMYPELKHINLIPVQTEMNCLLVLKELAPTTLIPILVLDFPLIENSVVPILCEGVIVGFTNAQGVLWIDHHADHPDMRREVSTTPLLCSWLANGNELPQNTQIVINHTDTDSILSAWIASGRLDYGDARFSQAAIAADHTGKPNQIADLLNGLEKARDIELSWACLQALLNHTTMPQAGIEAIRKREADREEAKNIVDSGAFTTGENCPGVYFYLSPSDTIRTEYVYPLLPAADIIVTACKSIYGDGYDYKIRIGQHWSKSFEGHSLHDLNIPYFGGRWNAGGTVRGKKPVPMEPNQYATIISEALSKLSKKTLAQEHA